MYGHADIVDLLFKSGGYIYRPGQVMIELWPGVCMCGWKVFLSMLYILQRELYSNGDYKDVRVVIVLPLENGFKRVEHNQ